MSPVPHTSDVIVIGGGGSGLATAVAAAEGGADVVLLERRSEVGGSTALSIGSLTAAGTPFQRRRGIVDDPDHLVEDMWKFDEELLSGDAPDLRRLYAHESARTLAWLIEHGVAFAGPFPEHPHRVPRMHNVIPNSRSYVARLDEAARKAGVSVITGAEAERLLEEDGGVIGVRALVDGQPRDFLANRGVVIASGDFSGNRVMREELLSRSAAGAVPINPDALGFGHRMAADVGAELKHMDKLFGPQLRFPASPKPGLLDRLPLWRWFCRLEAFVANNVPPSFLRPVVKSLLVSHMSPTDEMFRRGAILVNASGERFGREAHPADELALQPHGRGFLILDRRLAAEFDASPHHISTAPGIAFAYFSDYARGRPDLISRGADAAELAARIDVDPGALQSAVDSSELTGELIAMGPVHSMLTVTEGSISVDDTLRVLRNDGSPIAGLYAVGGAGQGGMLLKGHGHHIGWAMTSGRLAGAALAASETTNDQPSNHAEPRNQ
ncbi:FAD-dependent oxidoreductase [Microbacterium aerolatum]|uniref:FAD-dependent oxidoreductase n=1 Tax=Microbacterium aerolatum TaxID=153731 RepID=UPI00384E4A6E